MSHDGVGEVAEALAGLVSDLKGFRSEITQKMQKQEERLTMS
jgi:hypothetical protein